MVVFGGTSLKTPVTMQCRVPPELATSKNFPIGSAFPKIFLCRRFGNRYGVYLF